MRSYSITTALKVHQMILLLFCILFLSAIEISDGRYIDTYNNLDNNMSKRDHNFTLFCLQNIRAAACRGAARKRDIVTRLVDNDRRPSPELEVADLDQRNLNYILNNPPILRELLKKAMETSKENEPENVYYK